ncbi:MAG TPA: dTDP-4-dehydrorhamnose 3,5-epimerase family protein [Tenuifilaceae bacterium]|mgnify:CR=1 FL=1|nr:dTDP-4-dehydrorhamnose 3,5-epimerase family protein [Tenuifilaceae bacterium]
MGYSDFEIIKSEVFSDVIVIKPSISEDLRGNIYTSFNKEFYDKILPSGLEFIHDKFAESKHNVLRGLHGDTKTWKLVSCVWGELYEVVVDMRPESPSYKRWESFKLSSNDYSQVLIPPRFVNGYYVLSEKAVFHYKLAYSGDYIDANEQMTFLWNDPQFGIKWPCTEPILQDRDKK